jgi:hypothetical protein
MEEKSKNRRLIEIIIIIFVMIGTILVLSEIYQNVSEKINEKKSVSLQMEDVGKTQISGVKQGSINIKNLHLRI